MPTIEDNTNELVFEEYKDALEYLKKLIEPINGYYVIKGMTKLDDMPISFGKTKREIRIEEMAERIHKNVEQFTSQQGYKFKPSLKELIAKLKSFCREYKEFAIEDIEKEIMTYSEKAPRLAYPHKLSNFIMRGKESALAAILESDEPSNTQSGQYDAG
jgi:hypothetical protein